MATWTWSALYKTFGFTASVTNTDATHVRILATWDDNGTVLYDQTVAYPGGAFTQTQINGWMSTVKTAAASSGR